MTGNNRMLAARPNSCLEEPVKKPNAVFEIDLKIDVKVMDAH